MVPRDDVPPSGAPPLGLPTGGRAAVRAGCDGGQKLTADGTVGRVDGVAERRRRAVLGALALALLVRALLGLVDAVAIARGGVVALPTPEAVAVAPPSPLWPALFALLALGGGIGVPGRIPLGWVLGVSACVGYLISGIADLGMLRPGAPLGDVGFWAFFVANLVVPAVVLAGLLTARGWFMPLTSAPARLVGRWPRRTRRR